VLLAIRGAGLKRVDRGVPQAILAPRGKHSEKPEAAMAALERLFGDVRRLELFARRYRDGWTCWGNQLVQPCRALTALTQGVSTNAYPK
jgi:N6-adenosine-specific RNA methylase IME4